MSSVPGPSAINNLLHQVQNFQNKETPTQSDTNRLVNAMKSTASTLQNAAYGKVNAKLIDDKTLDRLAMALSALGARGEEGEPNLGNVILSLGELVEKMQQRKKEQRILRKGQKVDPYEVIEFLNSTEKEFVRIIRVITDQEGDEDSLIQFILELQRRMEILAALKEMAKEKKITLQTDKKIFKRILKYVVEMQESAEIHRYVYELGVGGTGNTHLRFWKALKQFQMLTEDFV